MPVSAWSHVCLQRNSNVFRMFVNGVPSAITSVAENMNGVSGFTIGNAANWFFNDSGAGYFLDSFKATKIAKYPITGFTPPVSNGQEVPTPITVTPTIVGTRATFSTSISAPALSGAFFGDGSRLTGIVGSGGTGVDSTKLPLSGGTLTGNLVGTRATFSTSVSAPALSGTFYGDGSGLINVKSSGVIVDPTSITSTLTSYIFKVADANEVILCNNTNPLTASVPANAFTVGTEIVLIQRGGVVTLSAGPGVTIESNGNKYKTNGTSAGVCLINIQSNVWFLGGSTAI